MHTPLWQVSPVVQAFPSSHGVLSGSGVPAQTPPSQVSLLVQEFSSSHAAPSSSAALPTQVPFWQVSAAVQALPSSQGVPVSGVTVQLAVPLQVRVLHWSEVQVMEVPTHWPLLVQVSLNEQSLPSSHLVPVSGVTVLLAARAGIVERAGVAVVARRARLGGHGAARRAVAGLGVALVGGARDRRAD